VLAVGSALRNLKTAVDRKIRYSCQSVGLSSTLHQAGKLIVCCVRFDLCDGQIRVIVIEAVTRDKVANNPTAAFSVVVKIYEAVIRNNIGTAKHNSVIAATLGDRNCQNKKPLTSYLAGSCVHEDELPNAVRQDQP
jgi:hypothetical protein